MAHFAKLDNNNIVTKVIVINNNELLDQDGNEIEQKGIDFCKSLYGQDTNWVQTSYNNKFRKHYAFTGARYDNVLDAFIAPKLYESWILNENTCTWEAPIPKPDQNTMYIWNEEILNWVEFKEQ